MRFSTKSFLNEAKQGKKPFSLFRFLHGYIYLKWPYFYIGIATKSHWLYQFFKPILPRLEKWLISNSTNKNSTDSNRSHARISFADTYHGKVLPIHLAEEMVTLNQEISLENLEKIIPYATAKDIILKNPDHIAVIQCPCRKSKKNPCQPLDVCIIIGEPFAGFAVDHHPTRARWISQSEALEIIRAEHTRGHVHHAFFKDAMLERFYAICNCCSCCCGAMQAYRNDIPMLASSGYIAERNDTKCSACGTCVQECPFEAISMKSGQIAIDYEKCMGCGVCVSKCPNQAIELQLCPDKGEPLEIVKLMESLNEELNNNKKY